MKNVKKLSQEEKSSIKRMISDWATRTHTPLIVNAHVAKVLRKNGILEEHGYRLKKNLSLAQTTEVEYI